MIRADLPPADAARLLLAVVIGVQAMMDLGVDVDVGRTAGVVLALLGPGSKSAAAD